MMQPGDRLLGRYEILSQIGSGGYGVIYKARQTSTGQLVAVKTLIDSFEDEATRQEEFGRFQREMQLIGRLSHPHIVQLIDSGVSDSGHRVMVLEYVDGHDLGEELRLKGALPVSVSRRIVMQVLDALSEAHNQGVVHRDLKPQNIMQTGPETRPNTKVLDFGIAGIANEHREEDYQPLTQKGAIPGTPSYMSPEQIRKGASLPASDIYSLGLIFLECLTGRRVVTGESVGDICVRQVTEPIEIPPEIASGPYGKVIAQACAKAVGQRFQSAEAMLAAMEGFDPSTTSTITGRGGTTPETDMVPLLYGNVDTDPRGEGGGGLGEAGKSRPRKANVFFIVVLIGLVSGVVLATSLIDSEVSTQGSSEQSGESSAEQGKSSSEQPANSSDTSTKSPEEAPDGLPKVETDAIALATRISSVGGVIGVDKSDSPLSTWSIRSTPAAKVYVAQKILDECPRTPCEFSRPRPEEALVVGLVARGYVKKTIKLSPDGAEYNVRLRHKKKEPASEESDPKEDGRIKEFE